MQNCTILEESRDSRPQATSPQLENPTIDCACKVENFATAVRPDVVVLHSKVSQIVHILGLVCQTVFLSDIIFPSVFASHSAPKSRVSEVSKVILTFYMMSETQ